MRGPAVRHTQQKETWKTPEPPVDNGMFSPFLQQGRHPREVIPSLQDLVVAAVMGPVVREVPGHLLHPAVALKERNLLREPLIQDQILQSLVQFVQSVSDPIALRHKHSCGVSGATQIL